jgi:hypothetical protein
MKNCVILTTTSNQEGLEYYLFNDKKFDIIIIDYTSENEGITYPSNDIKVIFESNGGYKYKNIKKCIETLDILEKYDYIWLPDWDVRISNESVNKLFMLAEQFNLDLCQPSLSSDSHMSWSITEYNPDSVVRLTNFVEVMCPLFKSSFLKEVLWTFDLNYSSWGLDFLWCEIGKEKTIGIIDSVIVKHERPISSHEWILPNGKTAHQELEELQKNYNLFLDPKVLKSLN